MEKKNTYKRKQYFVNKAFQVKLILKVYLYTLASALSIGILFFIFTQNRLNYNLPNQTIPFENIIDIFSPLFLTIALGIVLFTFLLIFWHYTLETHRIAGPMYHFEKIIKEIKNGNLNVKVSLRKNDEFQNVSWEFNEMVDILKNRIAGFKLDLELLSGNAQKIPSIKNPEERKKMENEIIHQVLKIKTDLDNLKT